MNLAEINHQNVTFHWKTLNLSQYTYNFSFRNHHLHFTEENLDETDH